MAGEVIAWLEDNGLERHVKAMTDPAGDIGLRSLNDLVDLLEDDIEDMIKCLCLNIGERSRLRKSLVALRDQRAAPTEATQESLMGRPNECFEVMKNMVFVRSAPRAKAIGVGVLRCGTHIQVRPQRHHDKDGCEWVQLTDEEFWRMCEPEPGKDINQGFAMIDGSTIGLGHLLRGPLSDHEVSPANGVAAQASAMANLQEGQALTHEERALRQTEQYRMDEERRLEQQRRDRQVGIADALERAKLSGEELASRINEMAHDVRSPPPQGAICLRSCGCVIYVKESQDSQRTARLDCRPGTCFYAKSGSEWQAPQGGLWIEHATKPGWMLIEDAKHGGALLLSEADTSDYATVIIDCVSSRGDIRVFEAFVSVTTTVRSLSARLYDEVGLRPQSSFLFAKRPPASGMPRKADVMQAPDRLLAHGVEPGMVAQLYLLYPFDFEMDFKAGSFLQVCSKSH